jgi:hypothetical protein
MAFTGVMNALDRGLLPRDGEVVIHNFGSYTADDYEPIENDAVVTVGSVEDAVRRLGERWRE